MTTSEREFRELAAALGDRYTAERELGRGGMGTVYLARDLQLDRNVAIKVLPREFAADSLLRERFVRETRVAASFSHPNIVPVHAVEDRGGVLAFVMGFVEGESLSQRVARGGPIAPRECVRLLQDIAYALAYAHGRGVVHRDIKPDNIMLERATGRALLMDFGVSRGIVNATNPSMTRVGEVVGTPEFMSPEQAAGEELDGRSDLYSLGLTAYFALIGTPAFHGDSAQRLLVRQLTEVLPPLASLRSDLSPGLAAAIDRCLAKDRAERFADAGALVDALEAASVAAPEVPVQIRLLAQEAATLGIIVTFITAMVWMMLSVWLRTDTSDDAMLPVVLLSAVVSMRIAQTYSEARRLFAHGFSVADVMRGFEAGLAERDERRREFRADPAMRAARVRSLRIAIVLLIAAPIALYVAYTQFRFKVRDGLYHTTLPGLFLLFGGLLGLGSAFPMLLRSPFRRPPTEKIFRAFWIGFPGRLFFGMAARSAARGAARGGRIATLGAAANALAPTVAGNALPRVMAPAPGTAPVVVATSALSAVPVASDDARFARLEARIARLEQSATPAR